MHGEQGVIVAGCSDPGRGEGLVGDVMRVLVTTAVAWAATATRTWRSLGWSVSAGSAARRPRRVGGLIEGRRTLAPGRSLRPPSFSRRRRVPGQSSDDAVARRRPRLRARSGTRESRRLHADNAHEPWVSCWGGEAGQLTQLLAAQAPALVAVGGDVLEQDPALRAGSSLVRWCGRPPRSSSLTREGARRAGGPRPAVWSAPGSAGPRVIA